jgi:hypothetical protein
MGVLFLRRVVSAGDVHGHVPAGNERARAKLAANGKKLSRELRESKQFCRRFALMNADLSEFAIGSEGALCPPES